MDQKPETIKVVSVGDGSTGKTCILLSYTTDKFPIDYVPTIFENYTTTIQVGQKASHFRFVVISQLKLNDIILNFLLLDRDTAGQDEYGHLRKLAYPAADVFLITFSVVEPASYENALQNWYKELEKSNPEAQKVFVGNKIDMREECKQKYQPGDKSYPIEFTRALKDISDLKCKYVECSAKTQEGLKNTFDTAISVVLKSRSKSATSSSNSNKTKDSKNSKEKSGKKKKFCSIF